MQAAGEVVTLVAHLDFIFFGGGFSLTRLYHDKMISSPSSFTQVWDWHHPGTAVAMIMMVSVSQQGWFASPSSFIQTSDWHYPSIRHLIIGRYMSTLYNASLEV